MDEKQLRAISKSGLPVPDKPTYKDYLVASVMLKSATRGFVDDLVKIMGIIGETQIQSDCDDKLAELLTRLDEESKK